MNFSRPFANSAILILLAGAFLVSGCIKDDSEERLAEENKLLDEYLTENNISDDYKTASGMYYIENEAGTGDIAVPNDFIVIKYTGKYIDETIFESTDSAIAQEAGIYFSEYIYGSIKFKYGYSIAGFTEGISYMRQGGKATFIIPSKLAYSNNYKTLIYDVELLEVIKYPAQNETGKMFAYISDSLDINISDSTSTGLYYIESPLSVAGGPTITTADSVYLKYTGRFLDGRIFDQTEGNQTFNFIQGSTGFISGFTEAIGYMYQGCIAKVVIPYKLGYGTHEYLHPSYGFIVIPAYTTLVFDLEVVKVTPF
ncbi:MAG: FKBP-type peptidyl-prolyl cis-trans isomerase [Bacteroidales bacterium]|nr:FKBP-type peptidyl-prolyl cis-trans isomerase [Bacteroidales bacterium]